MGIFLDIDVSQEDNVRMSVLDNIILKDTITLL